MSSTTTEKDSDVDDATPTGDGDAGPQGDDTQQMQSAGRTTPGRSSGRPGDAERTTSHRSSSGRLTGGTMVIDPAMIASAIAGVYLLVTGIVAIARAGFADLSLYAPEVTVGGLMHTPLLGFIEIVFGLLVLAAGTLDRDGSSVTFLGILALIIGLVWVIEADAFRQWLGVTGANGWQHIIMGSVLAVTGQISPFTLNRTSGTG